MGGFELTPPRPGRIPRIASKKHRPSRVSESTGCTDLWEQMGSTGAWFHGSLGAAIPKLLEVVGGGGGGIQLV